MKKSHYFLLLLVVVLLIVSNFKKEQTENEHLLEANLLAAIALESKFITYCGEPTFDFGEPNTKAPLLEGLGDHSFSISSVNEEAQRYFNQGLNLAYGFNHTEAHRSFKEASNISPEAPMTYWGQAYAIGPNINDPVIDNQRRKEALENLQKASELLNEANELEKALIMALVNRYRMEGDSIIVDNDAYMTEMKEVTNRYADNADVLTLYAAAIMNTMPWDYWNGDYSPKENTLKAKNALEKAIAINPKHAGAFHYHIHLTELPFPEEAAKSGDALAPLMPGAGHIVHMPSHAYIRVGRYKDAAESNLQAIKADEAYISQCYSQGIYPLGYYPHNIHFLWAAATQMGDSKTAIAAARKTAEKTSLALLGGIPVLQEFVAAPIQAYVRFGQWDEILTIPDPGSTFTHLKVYWHYGRGLAFISKGNLIEASEELGLLNQLTMDSTLRDIKLYSDNTTAQVAKIAHDIVAGELAEAKGEAENAKTFFVSAIDGEDALNYTEPPAWHLSTRLNYGDFLVSQGEYEKAIDVFKEDLEVWRSSGWALKGLHNGYKGVKNETKAKEVYDRFQEAWKYADITIDSAVL